MIKEAIWFRHKRRSNPKYPGFLVCDNLKKYEVLWLGNKRLLISKYLLNYSKRLKNEGWAGSESQSQYLNYDNHLTWGDHIWK